MKHYFLFTLLGGLVFFSCDRQKARDFSGEYHGTLTKTEEGGNLLIETSQPWNLNVYQVRKDLKIEVWSFPVAALDESDHYQQILNQGNYSVDFNEGGEIVYSREYTDSGSTITYFFVGTRK